MPKQNNIVYQFSTLSGFSLKQKAIIRIADLAFFAVIKLVGSSIRIKIRGIEHLNAIESEGKLPIYTTWHESILLSTYHWRNRGIVVMSSLSFDAAYIERVIKRFGYGAIKGSSTRGGAKAMVEMVRAMRSGIPMGFTVDGPKGPRHKVKPGIALLAKKTGNPIMPFVIEPKKSWILKSWDKLQIPHPFTSGLMIIGEPIYVNADDDEVTTKLAEVQRSLDDLVKQAAAWSGRSE
ncbi:MAG: lysophospholipid acyltransferase family protein [Chloracidobacterium sp.]|nr:lysophospholipid acyltransferase family protein [Chloracidobacterium sp.]